MMGRRAAILFFLILAFSQASSQLMRVVDKPADQRVVWQFSLKEYSATVVDSIVQYAAIDGRAELILSAEAKTPGTTDAKKRDREREREEREKRARTDSVSQDEIESESTEKRPPVWL